MAFSKGEPSSVHIKEIRSYAHGLYSQEFLLDGGGTPDPRMVVVSLQSKVPGQKNNEIWNNLL